MQIVAHRGYSHFYPDNTLLAYERAFQEGADFIEVDMMITSDGLPFIQHNLLMDGRAVREMDIQEALYGNWDAPYLDEVIALVRDYDGGIYLDVKDRALMNIMDRVLVKLKGIRLVVSSFDAPFIRDVKKLDRRIKTALLIGSVYDAQFIVEIARHYEADIIHPAWESRHPYPHHLLSEMLPVFRREGFEVSSWHEEREEVIEELLRMGVDYISTNDVPLAVKIRNNFFREVKHE